VGWRQSALQLIRILDKLVRNGEAGFLGGQTLVPIFLEQHELALAFHRLGRRCETLEKASSGGVDLITPTVELPVEPAASSGK